MAPEKDSELPEFLRTSDTIGEDLPVEKEVKAVLSGKASSWEKKEEAKKRVEAFLKANPGVYNPGLICDMQMIGLPRPDWIPAKEWCAGVQEMNPLHHLICYMAAYGAPPGEIAKKLGKNAAWVGQFLGTQDAKTIVFELQHKIFGMEPKKWIEQKILPLAVQTALDIMNDPTVKAQTRLTAAMTFMDRGLGKPKQEIEMVDSTIRSLLERLDAQEREKQKPVIDVTLESGQATSEEGQPSLEAQPPQDAIDRWVEENLNA